MLVLSPVLFTLPCICDRADGCVDADQGNGGISGQWGRRQRLRLAANVCGCQRQSEIPLQPPVWNPPARLGLERPEHGGILDRLGAGGIHDSIGKFKPAARRGNTSYRSRSTQEIPPWVQHREAARPHRPPRQRCLRTRPVPRWCSDARIGRGIVFVPCEPERGAHPGWAPPLRIESRTQCVGAGTMPLKTNFWMRLPSCTSVT